MKRSNFADVVVENTKDFERKLQSLRSVIGLATAKARFELLMTPDDREGIQGTRPTLRVPRRCFQRPDSKTKRRDVTNLG